MSFGGNGYSAPQMFSSSGDSGNNMFASLGNKLHAMQGGNAQAYSLGGD